MLTSNRSPFDPSEFFVRRVCRMCSMKSVFIVPVWAEANLWRRRLNAQDFKESGVFLKFKISTCISGRCESWYFDVHSNSTILRIIRRYLFKYNRAIHFLGHAHSQHFQQPCCNHFQSEALIGFMSHWRVGAGHLYSYFVRSIGRAAVGCWRQRYELSEDRICRVRSQSIPSPTFDSLLQIRKLACGFQESLLVDRAFSIFSHQFWKRLAYGPTHICIKGDKGTDL